MPIHNSDIADIFEKVANFLEIKGESFFRVRAYRHVAKIIYDWPKNLAQLVVDGQDLSQIPGIGKDLAQKIATIVATGKLPLLEELQREFPAEIETLLKLSGLGPKRVKILYEQLKIHNLLELKQAIERHDIQKIPGFGQKTEEALLREINKYQVREFRLHANRAEQIAMQLENYLRQIKEVKKIAIVGSYRRRKETIGDIDILVTVKNDTSQVMTKFIEYPEIAQIIAHGETKSTIKLRSGLQVDLRVIADESYGAALQYFTGSKEHNIALRKLAIKHGLKINEYGVYRGRKKIAGKTEEEVYATLGLDWMDPELREDRGEIEAAFNHHLPKLVELKSIKGDLHAHTTHSDGQSSLPEMVEAAKALGYEYLAITDHSKHVTIAHGLDDQAVLKLIKEIEQLRAKISGITILAGAEVDILDDGTLDLSDAVLKELDIVVCAIHYKFNLPEDQQTERIIRAMDNPYFRILAHPTGRLINERDPYAVNMEKIIQAAKERGKILELNSHPYRLDLNDIHCKMAKEAGVKVAISTDAHSINDLNCMRFGVNQARRGWLTDDDVLNTRNVSQLLKILKRG